MELQHRIPDSETTDIYAAIRAARRVTRSHKLAGMPPPRSNFSTGSFSRPTATYYSPSAPVSGKTQTKAAKHSQFSSSASLAPRRNCNSRHLTLAEAQEYRAKGKCYHCGDRYSPLHKYAAKYLTVILEAEDDSSAREDEELEQKTSPGDEHHESTIDLHQLQLSRRRSHGFDRAQTLKLFSKVHGRQMLTMIDSRASHCFISDHLAHSLQLSIDSSANIAVVLGDGT
ncbi:hypothetical protein C2S51_033745 [Perilla frutescens var. frutescens]|nr:hypothetical protein C2S51_033745 [Perilla frutescens var. frutescens]